MHGEYALSQEGEDKSVGQKNRRLDEKRDTIRRDPPSGLESREIGATIPPIPLSCFPISPVEGASQV